MSNRPVCWLRGLENGQLLTPPRPASPRCSHDRCHHGRPHRPEFTNFQFHPRGAGTTYSNPCDEALAALGRLARFAAKDPCQIHSPLWPICKCSTQARSCARRRKCASSWISIDVFNILGPFLAHRRQALYSFCDDDRLFQTRTVPPTNGSPAIRSPRTVSHSLIKSLENPETRNHPKDIDQPTPISRTVCTGSSNPPDVETRPAFRSSIQSKPQHNLITVIRFSRTRKK